MDKLEFETYREKLLKDLEYPDFSYDYKTGEAMDLSALDESEKIEIRSVRRDLFNTYLAISKFLTDEHKDFVDTTPTPDQIVSLTSELWDLLKGSYRSEAFNTFKAILKNARIYRETKLAKVIKNGKMVIDNVEFSTYYVFKPSEKSQNVAAQKSRALHAICDFCTFQGWKGNVQKYTAVMEHYKDKLGKGIKSVNLAPVATMLSDYACGRLSDSQFKTIDLELAQRVNEFKESAISSLNKSNILV